MVLFFYIHHVIHKNTMYCITNTIEKLKIKSIIKIQIQYIEIHIKYVERVI